MSEIIINVSRGAISENIIRGNIAVIGDKNKLIAWLGDPNYYTYMRSTAKPLQASAAVECGAIEHFGITEPELAIMCGSHIGDNYHIGAIESILTKISLTENDLTLGADLSFSQKLRDKRLVEYIAPRKVFNNCSGKHACMLTICRYMGWDHHDYQNFAHPVQQLIFSVVAAYAQMNSEDITIGIDGCGVPVFAMPLMHMAIAYHNLASPLELSQIRGEAAQKITTVIAAYPQMIAGYGHFCTELNIITQGRIIGKLGADGVYCAAIPTENLAIALKIEDGNGTMLAPVIMEILNQLGLLTEEEKTQLGQFAVFDNINCQNDKIGEVKAVFNLIRG